MEQQGDCWVWGKRKHPLSALGSPSNIPAYVDDSSWEEQAFAEDAAGNLGGCTWPPRFYSCSFCKREFRSAQALGGHMNVHRRDRARLKQSPGNLNPQDHHEFQIHHPNSIQKPFSYICPSKVGGLVYGRNPNSDPTAATSSKAEPSAVSAPPTAEIFSQDNLFAPYTSSIARQTYKMYPIHSSKPCTPFIEKKNLFSHDMLNPKNDSQHVANYMSDSGFGSKENNYLKTDLSVSLNLVVRRAPPTLLYKTEEEITLRSKKRRIDSSVPFSIERHHSYPKVFELSPSPIEDQDLDLELRLGDRPKLQ